MHTKLAMTLLKGQNIDYESLESSDYYFNTVLCSYQLSKHIASLISPLAGKTGSHVKNSKHFVEVMSDLRVEEDEMLVSFDVSSLFTNVPIDEAIQVICDRLRRDETLVNRTTLSPDRVAELLETCLKSTYYCYGGEFYEQREDAAMGSPVSAVVANLYMEFFEELALRSTPNQAPALEEVRG